jgi:MFS family permease
MITLGMAFIPIAIGMPYQGLLPVFNKEVLAQESQILGLLYTAAGVGSLLGSIAVAGLRRVERRLGLQLALGASFGISLALFAITTDYRISMVLLFFIGLFNQAFLTLNNTVVMANTPREYYGRIMSIYQLTWAVMPLGTIPVSMLADAFGISFAFTASGSLIAVIMAAIFFLRPNRSSP